MENLTPMTRLESYLAKIAGEDIITPEVKTRLEYYLNEIAENGGGGGSSGGGGLVVVFSETPLETLPDWVPQEENVALYETNVTYSDLNSALSSRPVSAYFPDAGVYTGEGVGGQSCVSVRMLGEAPGSGGIFGVTLIAYPSEIAPMQPCVEFVLYAHGENGKLYYFVTTTE